MMNRIHPIFYPACLALLISATPSATADPVVEHYRVTAIYGRATDGLTALVLRPEGTTVRVRSGDRIDDLLVEEVATRWIILRQKGTEATKRIWLAGIDPGVPAGPVTPPPSSRGDEGGGSEDRAPTPASQLPVSVPGRRNDRKAGSDNQAPSTAHSLPDPGTRNTGAASVNGLQYSPPGTIPRNQPASAAGTASVAAGVISGGMGTTSNAPGTSPTPDQRVQNRELRGLALADQMSLPQLAQHLRGVMNQENYSQRPVEDLNTVLGPLIGLPADSQIVEMESGAPTSFRDGMNYVLKAASENQIVRMSIETAEGRKRVMVFPGEQGGAARVMGTVSHQ